MTLPVGSLQTFQRVFTEDLKPPSFLTPEEVRGAWKDLFPELAACLPAPYPIFGSDEERIITYGYPLLVSEGIRKLRRELDKLVEMELGRRLGLPIEDTRDKKKVTAQRERYLRGVSSVIENVLMNDYGRGLIEVYLLFHSGDVVRSLGQVAKQARLHRSDIDQERTDEIRHAIAAIVAETIQRAAMRAADRLRQLADGPTTIRMSPVLSSLCQERLLLTESRAPADLKRLSGYLHFRMGQDVKTLVRAVDHALKRLNDLVRRHPEIGSLLNTAGPSKLRLDQIKTLLDPPLLDALEAAKLVSALDLSPDQLRLLRELGLRLKSFELLATLRRRIQPMERQGSRLVLSGPSSATAIAPSTRPFDFAAPGVVESLVRRCGLVYDLTNFTAVLEEVRKGGKAAEEKALQFMYVFQNRLEEIRHSRVLNFEKFLGDGALYSSRRAIRVLGAAAEIQLMYNQLRRSGFPFDQGIRIAMNYGSYRLLPMFNRGGGPLRFEFFGHGIVELARLTTGKSTREVEEIAEFLVHSGYDPREVDSFLAPLAEARSGHGVAGSRNYIATIDERGELINEGMVLTLRFLEELQKEVDGAPGGALRFDDIDWAVLALDPEDPDTLHVGLRLLGVARLKGLAPLELVEAVVWEHLPAEPEPVPVCQSLIELLRRLDQSDRADDQPQTPTAKIPDDLVVLTFLDADNQRKWVFGEYRHADDVLLHAVQIPMRSPELGPDEPLETWLFRNRSELAKLYEGVRRETPGNATPLAGLRQLDRYTACFLAAPHRAPGGEPLDDDTERSGRGFAAPNRVKSKK
jgi:hypothetical protein